MGTSPSTMGLAVIRQTSSLGSDGSSDHGPEKSPSFHFASSRNSCVRSALKRGKAGMIGMAFPLPMKELGIACVSETEKSSARKRKIRTLMGVSIPEKDSHSQQHSQILPEGGLDVSKS